MISFILPIRNEEKYIKQTIDSILNQKIGNDKYEIIIADGMSDDNTRHILDEYKKLHQNIQVIDNPDKIVPTGVNSALSISAGMGGFILEKLGA